MSNPKKTITLRRIAQLAGTSKSTVSRVLTRDPRISEETRARVLTIVDQHGYRPNLLARALAKGRTGQIGVLSSNISSGFFAEVIRGIDLAARHNTRHVLVSFAHGDDDYYRLFDNLRAGGQVDGVVLIDPPLGLFRRPLPASHIPVVLCACQSGGARAWRNVDSVTVNNVAAMKEVVRHLLAQGAKRMVHLAGPTNVFDAQERRKGFAQAARNFKIQAEIVDNCLIQSQGRDAIAIRCDADKPWPDAFVCFNDSVAFGVMAELDARKAPRVALTGWDNSPSAEVLQLTSVEMSLTRLGEMSARLLLDRLDNETLATARGRSVVLDMDVRLRASTQLRGGV